MGLLCRGSFTKLVEKPWRHSWLIPVALVLQLGIFTPWFYALRCADCYIPALYILSDILLLAAVALNLSLGGIKLLGLGLLLNLSVIAANGGYMPVPVDVVEEAGLMKAAHALKDVGHYANWTAFNEDTRLSFFSDILVLPFRLPGGRPIFSAGDVFIGYGVLGLIWSGMTGRDAEK